jgi:hypothetical protein
MFRSTKDTLGGASPSPSLALWTLILGGVGFSAGFFGPLIFSPDANQGPLVGILISGPGGAVLGLLLFGFARLTHLSPARQWQAIWAISLLLAIVTCCFVMPGPDLRGSLQDVQINSCERPLEKADDAVGYWNKRLATNRSAARPGWEEDSREMLKNDTGVILDVTIVRTKTLTEERKPWNKGHVLTSGWHGEDSHKTYYARYAGGSCSGYSIGSHAILFHDQHFYGYPTNLGWPPKKVDNFLNLQTLDSVPLQYVALVGD